MKKLLFLSFCLLALFACVDLDEAYPTPTADFTYPETIYANEVIELTPVSGNGALYCEWNLGGGIFADITRKGESILRGPLVRFPKAGTYTVKLTTRSRDYEKVGVKSNSVTKTITVKNSYTKAKLTGIVLNDMYVDDSKGWSPDLYIFNNVTFKLLTFHLTELYKNSTTNKINVSALPISFNFDYTITNIDQTYYILMSSKEYVWTSSWELNLNDYKDFPNTITLVDGDDKVSKITLSITWQ